ncbi:DinB family protein [Emticicia sp. BO119]|uniref:DinB family protein n=1 Tax=Emticicia sp. BO119 TaxID=2757768 RepID=UPI0015F0C46F|nr:DinB family protein [Emticicia sp. BO119]MBA4850223.1 DinB family protein [Emticicia sp. BO119]
MNHLDLSIKIAINNWQLQIIAFNSLLEKLSDQQLITEIAPAKNRGVYLLGHLTAVHDLMLPLLHFRKALYPELHSVFVEAADKTIVEIPPIIQLKEQWAAVNDTLIWHINHLPVEEWFTQHNSISEENFAKEPHRNRLNVLLSRTNHLSYHRGQLALLIKKS